LPHAPRHPVVPPASPPPAVVGCVPLRERLPTLPVPLRAPDPDVLFDLAAVFTTAYDRGRFSRRINYDSGVTGPLKDADRQWVETVRKRT
jgi:hypothetical protein